MGGKWEYSSKNMYKGSMDKAKAGRKEGGRWAWVWQGGEEGVKWRQLYLNNNKKNKIKKYFIIPKLEVITIFKKLLYKFDKKTVF